MSNQTILTLINKHITDATMQFSYLALTNNAIKQYCIQKGIYRAINEYIDLCRPNIYDIEHCNYEYFYNVLINSNENVLQ